VFDVATPQTVPLPGLLAVLQDWFESNHIERMRTAGFADARRAYNSVFANLGADGCRLTELARRADMTKQAMSELVDDLVERRYLVRAPDPSDGRARQIRWAARGRSAHEATMRIFGELEAELSSLVGKGVVAGLRRALSSAVATVVSKGDI
jgi:DNA-binding MarR family transcriptional regulator